MRFGKKEKIISACVGVVLTGTVVATVAINSFKDTAEPSAPSEATSEVENMEGTSTETKETNIDLALIENAVSEGINKIHSATEEALEKIQSTAQEAQKTVASEPQVSSEIPEPKTIPLDIVSETDIFKLTFTSVTINYEHKSINFKYDLSSTVYLIHEFEKNKCVDKSGKELNRGIIGGGGTNWNEERTEFTGKNCNIGFYGFSDPANIETVTLTYAFEGYDPVTLEIDLSVE